MKIRIFLILLVFIPALASAAIYKKVDRNGEVTFTDIPQKGAVELDVPKAQVYNEEVRQENSLSPKTSEQNANELISDYQVRLLTPTNDEVVWPSDTGIGSLDVSIKVDPELKESNFIVYDIDGKPFYGPTRETSVNLQNIDRGTHILQVKIVNEQNKVLAETKPFTFHMKRPFTRRPKSLNPLKLQPKNFQPVIPNSPQPLQRQVQPLNAISPLNQAQPLIKNKK